MSDGWDVVGEYADTVAEMVSAQNELQAKHDSLAQKLSACERELAEVRGRTEQCATVATQEEVRLCAELANAHQEFGKLVGEHNRFAQEIETLRAELKAKGEDLERLRNRVVDAEISLLIWDTSRSSEYWLRYESQD